MGLFGEGQCDIAGTSTEKVVALSVFGALTGITSSFGLLSR